MIANVSRTNQILTKYSLKAKKGFGQNFLIDANITLKIAQSANIDKETGVIEIGPGIGAMTEVLTQKAGKVLCYEIDSDMVNVLVNEIKNQNCMIIRKDFLEADLNEDLKYFEGFQRVIVVSNLPYYITTPIIFKLIEDDTMISEIYIMIQKEVALRLTGKPSSKEYGSLSVIIEYLTNAKFEFEIGRNCFHPAPNVDSALISLKKIKNDYNVKNEPKFREFIKNIFVMKRKTLVNNILSRYGLKKDEIEDKLTKLGYSKTIRSEQLSLAEIVNLYNALLS